MRLRNVVHNETINETSKISLDFKQTEVFLDGFYFFSSMKLLSETAQRRLG